MTPDNGSGPSGLYMGNDFRAAYAPGVTNTGAGQFIAIVDVGGPYYPLDVYMYETNAGLSTNIVVTNIFCTLTAAWTNALTTGTVNEGEEVLDIDMAMSMAPGATILNYEGEAHDVFNHIASDNKAKQMTLSYGFGIDATSSSTFQEFLAQGQAMSQASGDGGADLDGGTGLTGDPYATIVGGVSLKTGSPGGAWQSDPTWGGSGGGISGYGIPNWQQGVNMTTNQGSAFYRNYPDVAMPADQYLHGLREWHHRRRDRRHQCRFAVVGRIHGAGQPAGRLTGQTGRRLCQSGHLRALARVPVPSYTTAFTTLPRAIPSTATIPPAMPPCPGYDLCTGWGSPTGSNTIERPGRRRDQ